MGFLAALALLFAVGTWEFWLVLILVGIVTTALVENEEGVWATIVAIATIVGLNYVSKIPIWSYLAANPGKVAMLIGGYLVIGACWSIAKWYLYSHKAIQRYNEYKAEFLKEKKATELTPELASRLSDSIAGSPRKYTKGGDYSREQVSATPPDFRENKASLTRWATYWPFSILGTVLNDFVRKIWNHIIEMLQTTYERIANSVFKGATADMKMAAEYKASAAAAGKGSTTTSEDTPNRRRGY